MCFCKTIKAFRAQDIMANIFNCLSDTAIEIPVVIMKIKFNSYHAVVFVTIYVILVILITMTKLDLYQITIFGCDIMSHVSQPDKIMANNETIDIINNNNTHAENKIDGHLSIPTLNTNEDKLKILIIAYPR